VGTTPAVRFHSRGPRPAGIDNPAWEASQRIRGLRHCRPAQGGSAGCSSLIPGRIRRMCATQMCSRSSSRGIVCPGRSSRSFRSRSGCG
jgi:hypothetical protein